MEDRKIPQEISLQQAMQFAQTPAGQQLIALLRATGGTEFQNAMQQAFCAPRVGRNSRMPCSRQPRVITARQRMSYPGC